MRIPISRNTNKVAIVERMITVVELLGASGVGGSGFLQSKNSQRFQPEIIFHTTFTLSVHSGSISLTFKNNFFAKVKSTRC